MDLSEFEPITDVRDFNYLATPTRAVHRTDKLYLYRNGKMIYLGTFSEARAKSQDSDAPGYDIIGRDGTNYGSIYEPEIREYLFILSLLPPRPPRPPHTPSEYEKITEIHDLVYLATPIRRIQPTEGLYLYRDNHEMMYLGTLSEVTARSHNIAAQGNDVIGSDGTNYGDIYDKAINQNLFIKYPDPPSAPAPDIPERRDPSSLYTLAFMNLSSQDREKFFKKKTNEILGPHHSKITYQVSSNQNAGKFKGRKSHHKKLQRKRSRRKTSRRKTSQRRKS